MVSYVTDILREITINIAILIASFIGTLYDVIIGLGTARILTEEVFTNFATKIGTLLGVYMLFRLIFSLITYLINPDQLNDKKEGAGKIVTRMILVIVLLASYNAIFSNLYTFQYKVLNSDLIPGLFFDKDGTHDTISMQNGGKFALQYSGIFSSITERDSNQNKAWSLPSIEELQDLYANGHWLQFHAAIRLAVVAKGSELGDILTGISAFFPFVNTMGGILADIGKLGSGYAFEFNAIPCLLFTGFICYTMFVYAIKLAVRVAQMAFMQIIAPVPIISYMNPKDESLKTWAKMTFSCYIEIFVRFTIFYLIAFACYQVASTDIAIENAVFGTEWLVKLLIMCGLLIFADKFPDILKKIFKLDGSETYGLSLKKAMGNLYMPLKKGTAGVAGGVAGGVGAGISGGKGVSIAAAIYKGAAGGLKSGRVFSSTYVGYTGGAGIGYDRATIEEKYGKITDSELRASLRAMSHGELTKYQQLQRESDYNKSIKGYSDNISSTASNLSFIKNFQNLSDNELASGAIDSAEYEQRLSAIKEAKKAFVDKALNHNADISGYTNLSKYSNLVSSINKDSIDSREASSIVRSAASANRLIDEYNSTSYFLHKGEFSHIESASSNNALKKVSDRISDEFADPNGMLEHQKGVDELAKTNNMKLPRWMFGPRMGGPGGPGGMPPRRP